MSARPNILVVTGHDLGTRFGCYGAQDRLTPRADAFAREGVRFDHSFSTAAYCSPSRASMITGLYPHANGMLGLAHLGWRLTDGVPTTAQELRAAGYETRLFGLQHEVRKPEVDRLGFETVCTDIASTRAEHVVPFVESFLSERCGALKRPFYARVGFFEAHRPFDQSKRLDPASVVLPGWIADTPGAREDFAAFDATVMGFDRAFGRILDALDSAGRRDDTVVVLTTDHGVPFPGAKGTLYDPGIRTALMLRYPDGFVGGRTFDELVSGVDLHPTLLDLAGVVPSPALHGRSIAPLLTGHPFVAREWLFSQESTYEADTRRCVRTREHKLIRNFRPGPALFLPEDLEFSLSRRDMGNRHLASRSEYELYNLSDDPLERQNLAGSPAHAETQRELVKLLAAIQRDTADPLIQGPIARPASEARIVEEGFRKHEEAAGSERSGLIASYRAVQEGEWEFDDRSD